MRLFLLILLVMIAFAANSVLNKLALANGTIGPAAFAMIRIGAGAAMLTMLVFWQNRKFIELDELTILSTGSLSLYVLGFSYAYVTLDAGVGALILFGGVQITMFAGAVLSGEKLPKSRWTGAAIAFAGLAYLLAPGGSAPDPVGTVLMAAAALGWGYYSLYGRAVKRALQATAANFLLAVPVALVVGAVFWDVQMPQAKGVLLAITSGAVTSGLGYALWYVVLPKIEASVAAVAQLSVPIIALAGGMIFLGEKLTAEFAISATLILGGIAISIRRF